MEGFLLFIIALSLVFWQLVIKVSAWVVCANVVVFVFRMEMAVVPFPRCGIVLVLRAMLRAMFVSYLMASDPRCFRCLMFIQSGPVESFFVLFEVANCT